MDNLPSGSKKAEEENEAKVILDADNAESGLPIETNGNDPLELLTQDDWINVLGHVDMPRDGWNLAHAHPLFWRILHADLKDLWTTGMFLASVPHLLNYLPFEDVLGLRLVNQFSRSAVDHCLEEGQVIPLNNFKTRVFLSPENQIFVRGVQGNTRMPNLAPWMKLELVCSGIQHQFADFLSFSRQHGAQVEDLSFLPLDDQRAHPVIFLSFLRTMLLHLPNVKKLLLCLDRCLEGEWESEPQRLAGLVAEFLEENPLPALPSLEKLAILGRSEVRARALSLVPEAVLQAYGGHLQELQLLMSVTVNLPNAMSCLHTLNMVLRSPEDLLSIRDSGAPLRSLSLHAPDNPDIRPEMCFMALEPFKDTLTYLEVTTNAREFSEIPELPVKLPLVKTLSLGLAAEDCTPNNLLVALSFPNLEELQLSINLPGEVGPEERQEMLQEYLSQFEVEQLQKPNLWTSLVSLQVIKIVDLNDRPQNTILVKRPSEL